MAKMTRREIKMKNPKVQFVVVSLLLITIVLLLIPSLTQANPKGTPAWQGQGQNAEPQRDGYSRSFVVDANSVLLEVPEGRCYVLLRLHVHPIDQEPPYIWDLGIWGVSWWTLMVDGQMFLTANALSYDGHEVTEEFPDRCVVIRGGQTLGITKLEQVEKVNMTLIGYFCDAP
jgi:hypothetical protein